MDLRKNFSIKRVVKPGTRLPGEVTEPPWLEGFHRGAAGVLRDLG